MNNKTKEDLEHILDNFKKYILISSSSSEVTSWRKDIGMIYFNYKNNFDYLYDVVSGLINNNNLFYNHKIRNEVINISCEDGYMHELDSEYKKLVEKAVTLGIEDFDYSIYDEDGLKNKIFQKTHVKMRKKNNEK